MSGKTLEVIGKLACLFLFLVFSGGVSVLLEHIILNFMGADISAGVGFFAGFCFCQFYNYIFKN